jgi:hypothetical protein
VAEQPMPAAANGTEMRLDALLTLGRDLLAELRAGHPPPRPERPAGVVDLRESERPKRRRG